MLEDGVMKAVFKSAQYHMFWSREGNCVQKFFGVCRITSASQTRFVFW